MPIHDFFVTETCTTDVNSAERQTEKQDVAKKEMADKISEKGEEQLTNKEEDYKHETATSKFKGDIAFNTHETRTTALK